MKPMRPIAKIIGTSFIIFLAHPLYLWVSQKELSLAKFSDYLFLVGLASLCVGTFLAIILSGFFDFFQKSMKGFLRPKEAVQVPDAKPLSESSTYKSLWFWFSLAGICIMTSLCLLLFF